MGRAGGRAPSIARAAIQAGAFEEFGSVPPVLRIALVGLNRTDAELVERLLAFARGTRYSCVRPKDEAELLQLARCGLVDAVLLDLDSDKQQHGRGRGLPSGGRIATVGLLDDWQPGTEERLVRAGIADVLEKEELETERLDRAIRFAVARAYSAAEALAFAWPDRSADGWSTLRMLLARAIAAHARRRRSFALLRLEMSPVPGNAPDLIELWQRARSLVIQRLRNRLRRSDPILEPRPGRFAVLVEDLVAARDAVTVACKLDSALCEPLRIGGQSWPGSLCGVWAVFPEDGREPEALIQATETALATPAGGSGPQAFVNAELAAAYQRAQRLGPAFGRALLEGAIELGLQPQTTLAPGPVGLTAVPCWQAAGVGRLYAEPLRELAALTGQLEELTHLLLNLSCRQLARWHAEGLSQTQLGVPVLSRRQLARSDLPAALRRIAGATGVTLAKLELELPAHWLEPGEREARAALSELAASGVRLALRVEPSSCPLMALRELGLHTLKLAPELLDVRETDHRAISFLRGLKELAQALGLRLVAEDATDLQRLKLARAIGCDAIQAVTAVPPLPEAEARKWLLQAHRRVGR